MNKQIKKISLMDLYNVGAHRGNHKSRVNPSLKKYIHQFDTSSLAIIDLVKTIDKLDNLSNFFKKLGLRKKQIFIVGTSKYLKEYTGSLATSFGPNPTPYVNSRWLGGCITNWPTIKKTLKTLEKLESILNNAEFFGKLSRNEQLQVSREYQKKDVLFGGLKSLKTNKPGAIIVLDGQKNYTAILEAQTIGVPVIVFGNTNTKVLPKNLENLVVFNNTSLEAVQFVTNALSDAYSEGWSQSLTDVSVIKKNNEVVKS